LLYSAVPAIRGANRQNFFATIIDAIKEKERIQGRLAAAPALLSVGPMSDSIQGVRGIGLSFIGFDFLLINRWSILGASPIRTFASTA